MSKFWPCSLYRGHLNCLNTLFITSQTYTLYISGHQHTKNYTNIGLKNGQSNEEDKKILQQENLQL